MAKGKKQAANPAQPMQARYVRDLDVLGRDAATVAERRTVLASALSNDWAAADVDTLERVDQPTWHGWAMWPRA
jgi:hypothetical protein